MAAMSELIEWHLAGDVYPDADETVLIVERDEPEVIGGFFDGERWRDIEGFPLKYVLFWSAWPSGPAQ